MYKPAPLVGVLAGAVLLIAIVIAFVNRDSGESTSIMPTGLAELPVDDDQPPDSAIKVTAGSSESSDELDRDVTSDGVNPIIDRYGVSVSTSLPIQHVTHDEPQSGIGNSPSNGILGLPATQSPELTDVDVRGDQLPGPDASDTGGLGLPPESSVPQYPGQAPEAFDSGLPMLPPDSTDAGINGPGPGAFDDGVPATPPEAQ